MSPQRRAGRARPSATRRRGKRPAATAEARVFAALARMRKGASLTAAAKKTGTTPLTIRRRAGAALAKLHDGRYAPVFDDPLPRTLYFLTPEGRVEVTVRSSRQASVVGQYFAALSHYLRTGNAGDLLRFRRKAITVNKRRLPFVTDLALLRRFAYAGELAFTDLYAHHA